VKRYGKYSRKERISTTTTAADRRIYAAAAAAAAAAAIALKFHPKHEKRQNLRQNETHYENITH
jgi:hypothetical protein